MAKLSAEVLEQIRAKILSQMERTRSDIEELKELTKPIAPENSIGRISRMDAINNKSVNEAALRNSRDKLGRLERTLKELELSHFGTCRQCGNAIEVEKLLVMPESVRCVTCVKSTR